MPNKVAANASYWFGFRGLLLFTMPPFKLTVSLPSTNKDHTMKQPIQDSIKDVKAVIDFMHKLIHVAYKTELKDGEDLLPLVKKKRLKPPGGLTLRSLTASKKHRDKKKPLLTGTFPAGAQELSAGVSVCGFLCGVRKCIRVCVTCQTGQGCTWSLDIT